MNLVPFPIAPFRSGLFTDLEPWLAPPDSFSTASNVHVHHNYIEKREGYRLLGTLSQGDRVMGIYRYLNSTGTQETLAWDTTRAYLFNTVTDVFDIMDAAAIMSGDDEDYIWAINWNSPEINNRLYFTNGKAYDGSVDGIRYYDGSGLTTTAFRPNLDTTGVTPADPAGNRILWGCKLLFLLNGRLLALSTNERDVGAGTTTNFYQRARWCKVQSPSNWDDVTPGGGGFVDAPTGERIVSGRALQNQIIVYFTNSVWTILPNSNPSLPFIWKKLNDFRACDGKMATIGYDRYVVAHGVRGITATDGVRTQRIDTAITDFADDEINVEEFGKVFCERSYSNERRWSLYASNTSSDNDAALIYDDESGAYTTYDIDLNCLGFANFSIDFELADFTAANNLDLTLEEAGEDSILDYFWQDTQETLVGGDTSGNIYVLETLASDNGASIDVTLVSAAWNPFVQEGRECQMPYIDIFVDTDEQTTGTFYFYKDNDTAPYGDPQTFNFLPDLGYISDVLNIDKTNPALVNSPNHGLSTGDKIYLYNVEGMELINGGDYTITNVSTNFFSLDGIDATTASYAAYTTGGAVYKRKFYRTKTWKRVEAGGTGYWHRIKFEAKGVDRPLRIHSFKPYFRPIGKRTVN